MDELTETARKIWGADGERWGRQLPGLIDELMREWELTPDGSFPLSINWVAPVRRADGTPAVLKLGVPGDGHIAAEAGALEIFGGDGAVKVLRRDDERGALLLERVLPGTMLRTLVPGRDEEATAVLIDLMRRLHKPRSTGIRLETYADSFTAYLREHPGDELVGRAAGLFTELCAGAPERVQLHGDLHHDNVLSAGDSHWLAIDPHGIIGDPGYEVGAMLYNPDPASADEDIVRLVPARIEQLADGLGLPVDRVTAWGFTQAVLSEVWTVEGGGQMGGTPMLVALSLLPRL